MKTKKPLSEKVSLITTGISPDFIGDKPEDMEVGTISPDPMFHYKDVAEAVDELNKELDKYFANAKRDELGTKEINILEIGEIIDKIFGSFNHSSLSGTQGSEEKRELKSVRTSLKSQNNDSPEDTSKKKERKMNERLILGNQYLILIGILCLASLFTYKLLPIILTIPFWVLFILNSRRKENEN